MKIAFVGLGVMGRPMAGHLLDAGYELYVFQHRSPIPGELLDRGAMRCRSKVELASMADIVILMLPSTADVEYVLFGDDGLADGLFPGKTVIDMSSIGPAETRQFAAMVEQRGCDYLDAPVSGGEVGAKTASLSIMVGGKAEVFARMRPVLTAMGKDISLIGPIGSGQIAKIANQIIVALTIEAVAEGLLFAAKAGADPAKVRAAIMGGFASSRVLEFHGERMLSRNFDPGARIELHRKDLNMALDIAQAVGLLLPNTERTEALFGTCVAKGKKDWDHSAIMTALEIDAHKGSENADPPVGASA
ncbi:2-hydroxy-3-oxopropionate reductase [Sphingomonas sp. DT-204]|uniref:2-hydroxy-3-oxopropionate reductase n=1 Tax=Sphingomonas sp. DT-204 TaxID=3396166 RepID=UPI003F1D5DB1